MQARKQVSRLTTQNCVFLECDFQEKMRGLIKNFDTVSHNAQRLGKMANLFQIPIIATAQAPKVFGPTIKELSDLYTQFGDGAKHFTKNTFSKMEPQIYEHLQSLQRKKIVLYGIEAHICVKQTALDLLERDFDVCLVIDAVSSMSYHDRTAGIGLQFQFCYFIKLKPQEMQVLQLPLSRVQLLNWQDLQSAKDINTS